MRITYSFATLGLLLASQVAQAEIIFSLDDVSNPTQVIHFDDEDGLLIGVGDSYSALYNNPLVTLSADGDFMVGERMATDLGVNGAWGDGKSFLSFYQLGNMTLRIDFNGLKTNSFAAQWSLFEEKGDNRRLTVTAYGIDGSNQSFELENFSEAVNGATRTDPSLLDNYNYAITRGIWMPDTEIAYVTVHGDGVVMDNFTYTMPVPEAGSYAMLLAGLGLMGFVARRRSV